MENKKQQLCQVCGQPLLTPNSHVCHNCGWVQELDLDGRDQIHWSYNFVSYNKAKLLYSQGKPLSPDFDDFLECMSVYGELEFLLNGVHYGIIYDLEGKINFYEWYEMEKGYQIYDTIEEFGEKANIDGVLLRDLWDKATDIGVAS